MWNGSWNTQKKIIQALLWFNMVGKWDCQTIFIESLLRRVLRKSVQKFKR
jgi:hypothetical protein